MGWRPLERPGQRNKQHRSCSGDGWGRHLYAGGAFTTAGGVAANHIARWNGTTRRGAPWVRDERRLSRPGGGPERLYCLRRRAGSLPPAACQPAASPNGRQRLRHGALWGVGWIAMWGPDVDGGQPVCRRRVHHRRRGDGQLHRQMGWQPLEPLGSGMNDTCLCPGGGRDGNLYAGGPSPLPAGSRPTASPNGMARLRHGAAGQWDGQLRSVPWQWTGAATCMRGASSPPPAG